MKRGLIIFFVFVVLFVAPTIFGAECYGEWDFYNSQEGGVCCEGFYAVEREARAGSSLCNSSLGNCDFQCQPIFKTPSFGEEKFFATIFLMLAPFLLLIILIFYLIYYFKLAKEANLFLMKKYPKKANIFQRYWNYKVAWWHILLFPSNSDEKRNFLKERVILTYPVPNKEPFISLVRKLRITLGIGLGLLILFGILWNLGV